MGISNWRLYVEIIYIIIIKKTRININISYIKVCERKNLISNELPLHVLKKLQSNIEEINLDFEKITSLYKFIFLYKKVKNIFYKF